MYMMVNDFANVYTNLNQWYMAGMMTVPMVLIELVLMRSMYSNKRLNLLITLLCVVIFITCIIGIRKQILISDKEFLKSMIPHHGAALLMCQKASLQDPEIKELCKNIGLTQQAEIDFMKSKLERMEKK